MTTTNDGLVRLDSLPQGGRFQFADEDRVYVVTELATSEGGAVHVRLEKQETRFGQTMTIRPGEMVRVVR